MRQLLSLLLIFGTLNFLRAQLPETDIWLFTLSGNNTLSPVPVNPVNITNRSGYDNQPSFSGDGKYIYYASVRDDKQSDIYKYGIRNKKTLRFTFSEESEYSPVENSDGKYLATVVVEKDSAQRVHLLNTETGVHDRRFAFDSVGYYEFINRDTLLYYKLTEPHSLRFFVISTAENKFLGSSPTRAFKRMNRHRLIYGLKDSASVNYYIYDFFLRKAELYCSYPSLDEDFIWHPIFGLVKSEKTKLLRYDATEKKWVLLYDLSATGIKKITRFAFDPKNKYLVVVDNT